MRIIREQLILVLVSTALLFSLSGCIQPEKEYIYVYRDCPELQTAEVKKVKRNPLTIKYTVKKLTQRNLNENRKDKQRRFRIIN